MERQLTDRIETYDHEIIGHCKCGQPVNKIINSSVSGWKDKTRYRYTGDKTAANIFRCVNCMHCIQGSWRAGVVSNFAHKLPKDAQTEALNKHNVMGRSELLPLAFVTWLCGHDDDTIRKMHDDWIKRQ